MPGWRAFSNVPTRRVEVFASSVRATPRTVPGHLSTRAASFKSAAIPRYFPPAPIGRNGLNAVTCDFQHFQRHLCRKRPVQVVRDEQAGNVIHSIKIGRSGCREAVTTHAKPPCPTASHRGGLSWIAPWPVSLQERHFYGATAGLGKRGWTLPNGPNRLPKLNTRVRFPSSAPL